MTPSRRTLFTMPFPAKTNNDSILEAAVALLRSEGVEALSMRNLAARLGLRASSLYRHFPGRAELDAAMGEYAAAQLFKALEKSVRGLSGTEALEAAARAYLRYARAEAALYDLLMGAGTPEQPGSGQAGKAIWNLLLKIVGELSGAADDTAAAVAVWSFLHGFTLLERSGRFGRSGPKGGLERGLAALSKGLRDGG
jgi:AcrR family transcriptional regulator